MAQLYDEICRTLATPMPRSRALKLIFGGLARARFWLLSVLDNRIRHSSVSTRPSLPGHHPGLPSELLSQWPTLLQPSDGS